MSYYQPPGTANGVPAMYDQASYATGGNASQPPFQMPASMPPINFSAPVIRMGLPQGSRDGAQGYGDNRQGGLQQGRNRLGLGADSDRPQRSEAPRTMTREEVARTIFVDGLIEGSPDDMRLEDILGAGQGLRRWTRVFDAEGKPCPFGFAEYDDAASLDTAAKILDGLKIPLVKNGVWIENEDGQEGIKDTTLNVRVDPKSIEYINQWTKTDEEQYQERIEQARQEAQAQIQIYKQAHDPERQGQQPTTNEIDLTQQPMDGAEMITIQAVPAVEDELSDIPADKREMIAAEIAAFRNRSTRRDMERLKQEQEMEQAQRQRTMAPRFNRLADQPIQAPTGPAERTNGHDGHRVKLIPKDYVDGLTIIQSGADEDEDDSFTDAELFQRSRSKLDEELEKRYLDQKQHWMQAESAHFAALERHKVDEAAHAEKARERQRALAEELEAFDDEAEIRKPTALFYKNRRKWRRERRSVLRDERRRDDNDRRDEKRENGTEDADSGRDRRPSRRDDDRQNDDRHHNRHDDRQHERPSTGRHGSHSRTERGSLGSRSRHHDDDGYDHQDLSSRHNGTRHSSRGASERRDRSVSSAESRHYSAHANGTTTDPFDEPNQLYDADQQERRNQIAAMLPRSRDAIFSHDINWRTMTPSIVMRYIKPVVDDAIREALGEADAETTNDVLEIVRNEGTSKQLLKQLKPLEEDADRIALDIWREVIIVSQCAANRIIEG